MYKLSRLLFPAIILFFIAGGIMACSQTEKNEGTTAEITAAQMEGRRAAGKILAPEWKDTMGLQNALLEAKASQSKYVIEGKTKCAEAFDSAFISTLRTVNPDLAKKIQP